MSDVIEYLEGRDDVRKTEYTRVSVGDMRKVHTEMWHDAEGLHGLFQKSMTGHVSEKEMMESAKSSALAVRETTTEGLTYLKAQKNRKDGYEYKVQHHDRDE